MAEPTELAAGVTLMVVSSAASALALVFSVMRAAGDEPSISSLRFALHDGDARDNTSVERALAVLRSARAREIVATGPAAHLASTIAFARVVPRNPAGMLGLRLFTLEMVRGESVLVKDPICGKSLDRSTAPRRILRGREVFYFCSRACVTEFRRRAAPR